jgi:hypothetical protein
MKTHLKILFFITTLIISTFSTAKSEELLNNTTWVNSPDNKLATTYFLGNPFNNEEGVSLSYGCFYNESNKKVHAINLYIGDQGSIPKDMKNHLNTISTNRDKVLNNKNLGFIIDFSDETTYKSNFIFVSEQMVKSTKVTTLIVEITPEMFRKMKTQNWIDIELFAKNENFSLFKPFTLKGSSKSINNVKC